MQEHEDLRSNVWNGNGTWFSIVRTDFLYSLKNLLLISIFIFVFEQGKFTSEQLIFIHKLLRSEAFVSLAPTTPHVSPQAIPVALGFGILNILPGS